MLLKQDLGPFAQQIYQQKYAMGRESWPDTARRVSVNVLGALGYHPGSDTVREVEQLIADRKFIPGGRYLYAAGRDLHQVNNCLLMNCEDSREGWADLLQKAAMALMTGAGIGVVYSDVRPEGSVIKRTGGHATGPLATMRIVNELGRNVMQGGTRRSAIWAGLSWKHDDIFSFIRVKDWDEDLRALKARNVYTAMDMELTNISVILDDEFFVAVEDPSHPLNSHANEVYRAALSRMLKTGEPGFSIDTGVNAGETLRNACTEVTSADDSDICNLGSINLGRIESKEEFRHAVDLSTLFLIAGTVYSDVPYEKVKEVREKNRRLGLGLMGVHEWLLQRERPYGPDDELGEWLLDYQDSGYYATQWAERHSLSTPVKTRALAPNGTIGIIGETTTSIEPIFCVSYKRTYLEGKTWQTRYIIDPVAQRLIEQGVPADSIEDAYSLAGDVERRINFQHWMQQYVDHGISSTINLPAPIVDGDEVAQFSDLLLGYLPGLRGVTVYPDGARAGQPIVAVPYEEAVAHHAALEANEEACVGGVCAV